MTDTFHAEISILRPGDKLRANDGEIVELARRKEPGDLPGWWLTDGGGLADHALWGRWTLIDVGRPEAPTPELCAAKAAAALEAGNLELAAGWTDLARVLS